MSKLAINGGKPVLTDPLREYNSIGKEEIAAANDVLKSGCLSKYVGAWCDDFLGGPAVKQFEDSWRKAFGSKHAVSVNSATSGLFAAAGAIGIGPGDEVIVSPYTMSATAMAPLAYGGIPVFADIEPQTFGLDPADVRRKINSKTKAIFVTNLFGHPARLSQLKEIADEHGIWLVEDNAQAPFARENGKYAGTIGHIGVFSLNYHKHIHVGEGGVCITDDDELALRLQLIRNHGENSVKQSGVRELTNLFGFNYRLTELNAAIGSAQLRNAETHIGSRERLAARLNEALCGLTGIIPPVIRDGCRHVFYVLAARYDEKQTGVSRDAFSRALTAEGVPNHVGYVQPLYWLPLFQQRVAMGAQGFPFNLSNVSYEKGICPVTEQMHERELIWFPVCAYDVNDREADLIAEAIYKVHANRSAIADGAVAGGR